MRIVAKDLKHGLVKLKPESQDDLWYLSQLIEIGDALKGRAERKVKLSGSSDKARADKKVFTARIKVESVTYEAALGSLRVNGTMAEEHEHAPTGSHQSISVEPGQVVTIKKDEWLTFHLERLKESSDTSKAVVMIVVHDREEAYIARMKPEGYEMLTHLQGDVQKKADNTSSSGDFYSQLGKALEEYNARLKPNAIIVASPAFFAEDLLKTLKDDSFRKIIVKASCSSVSRNAIDEVLKRDETKSVLNQQALAKEAKAVEELLERIAKQGLASYGWDQVKTAVDAGAAETLLVTDSFIMRQRENEGGADLDRLMRATERSKGRIIIVSAKNEPGSRLDGLGGIAALLRYAIG